jgi:Fic family protein
VPPPPDRMRQSIGEFDKYVGLADESPLPKLIDLRESYRERLQTNRSPANLLRLVDELFEVPVLTVATAAKRLGVTWRSARGNVDKLVATDILGEIDSPGRSRLFIARGILDTIESSAFTSETGE